MSEFKNLDKIVRIKKLLDNYSAVAILGDEKLQLEILCKIDNIMMEE